MRLHAISSSVANGLNQVVAPALAVVDKKHAKSKTNNCIQPLGLCNIGLLSFSHVFSIGLLSESSFKALKSEI